ARRPARPRKGKVGDQSVDVVAIAVVVIDVRYFQTSTRVAIELRCRIDHGQEDRCLVLDNGCRSFGTASGNGVRGRQLVRSVLQVAVPVTLAILTDLIGW